LKRKPLYLNDKRPFHFNKCDNGAHHDDNNSVFLLCVFWPQGLLLQPFPVQAAVVVSVTANVYLAKADVADVAAVAVTLFVPGRR